MSPTDPAPEPSPAPDPEPAPEPRPGCLQELMAPVVAWASDVRLERDLPEEVADMIRWFEEAEPAVQLAILVGLGVVVYHLARRL